MIRENQRLLNRLNVLSDGAILFVSLLLAHAVRFRLFHGVDHVSLSCRVWLGAAAALLGMSAFLLCGLYESHRFSGFEKEAAKLLWANLLDTLLLTAALFVFHLGDVSRWMLVCFFCLSSVLLLLKRGAARALLHRLRRNGRNQKRILLVGEGPTALSYLKKLGDHPEFGYQVIGYAADGPVIPQLSRLGGYGELEAILDAAVPDEVVMALPAGAENLLPHLTGACEKSGIRISLIPGYADFISSNPRVDTLDGLPMVNLRSVPLDNLGNALLKRAFDLTGASLLLVLTSPLMLAAAAGVRLSSPGPILFRQERVGKGKKTFTIYKFRSMCVNSQSDTAWSTAEDQRRTAFGAWMRRHSIDELPQLLNVLKGDMSLVGPRPEIPFYVDRFREEIPRYMVKHQVRPGMTGWAQVNGLRGDTSIRRRIEYDLYYIENWNPLLDMKILCMTPFCLSGK